LAAGGSLGLADLLGCPALPEAADQAGIEDEDRDLAHLSRSVINSVGLRAPSSRFLPNRSG
jgi:hypothetical protein